MARRKIFLAGIVLLTAAAGALLALSRSRYHVGFGSVVELWADLTRDVDRAGLAVTRVSPEREMQIGREIEDRVARFWRLRVDSPEEAYVAAVGRPLLEHVQRRSIEYRFRVVETPMINAFALPGGGIFVTTGMLEFLESEAELAAILGHEISHVDLRHCIEQLQYELALRKIGMGDLAEVAELGYALFGLGFSEQRELEADGAGVILAAKAGYDPRAATDVFARLGELETSTERRRPGLIVEEIGTALGDALEQYFSTHPPSATRIRNLQGVSERNGPAWRGTRFYVGRSNFRDRVPRSREARDAEWRGE